MFNSWENFKNHSKKFRKISRNTLDIFEYLGKFLRLGNFQKSQKLSWKVSENFQKYFRKLQEVLPKF